MAIETVSANVSCRHLETSIAWYAQLFSGPPLRRPMPGLAEWRIGDRAEVQLFEAPGHAGHSTLTLGAGALAAERERLLAAGFAPGAIEEADHFQIIRMRDPDDNLVVLVGPRRD